MQNRHEHILILLSIQRVACNEDAAGSKWGDDSASCRQREWPPALQPAVDYVRERWSEEQQTVGGLIGVNVLVHLLWRVPGLQVGSRKPLHSCLVISLSASASAVMRHV